MIPGWGATLLAWLFVQPFTLPHGARLWMVIPLVACVAVVYRGTRVRTAAELPRGAIITFVNILVGMVVVAAAFYVAHVAAKHFL